MGLLVVNYQEAFLGLLGVLVLGSYVYTYMVAQDTRARYDELVANHLRHVQEELDALRAAIRQYHP
jgi:hypothetical protein